MAKRLATELMSSVREPSADSAPSEEEVAERARDLAEELRRAVSPERSELERALERAACACNPGKGNRSPALLVGGFGTQCREES